MQKSNFFKKKSFITILAVLFVMSTTLLSFSCTSTKSQKNNPNFLGDFDPVELQSVMALTKQIGPLKPKEIKSVFYPRKNIIELYFTVTASKIRLTFTPELRQMFLDSAIQFLNSIEEESLENRSPKIKNAYSTSTVTIAWGVIGYGHSAKNAKIYLNYEFIEGKPYFLLQTTSAIDDTEHQFYSPDIKVYFSPTQLTEFCEIISQENLLGIMEELNTKAFTY